MNPDKKRALIQEWKDETDALAVLFKEKKYKTAVEPMRKYTHNLIELLCLLNHEVDSNLEDCSKLDQFKHAPINIAERVTYIKDNLSQYHAYIQLDALFKEVEKIMAKVEILEQRKKA